jgi:hypothetical protein
LDLSATESGNDRWQAGDQSRLFYAFNLEQRIPARHHLRRVNPIVTRVLAELRTKLKPFYSAIGRPSIDPELTLRMLVVGYCYGIRFERKLCEGSLSCRLSGTNGLTNCMSCDPELSDWPSPPIAAFIESKCQLR